MLLNLAQLHSCWRSDLLLNFCVLFVVGETDVHERFPIIFLRRFSKSPWTRLIQYKFLDFIIYDFHFYQLYCVSAQRDALCGYLTCSAQSFRRTEKARKTFLRTF